MQLSSGSSGGCTAGFCKNIVFDMSTFYTALWMQRPEDTICSWVVGGCSLCLYSTLGCCKRPSVATSSELESIQVRMNNDSALLLNLNSFT